MNFRKIESEEELSDLYMNRFAVSHGLVGRNPGSENMTMKYAIPLCESGHQHVEEEVDINDEIEVIS
jgi:hypothetical protein